jgi:hypothetical protein
VTTLPIDQMQRDADKLAYGLRQGWGHCPPILADDVAAHVRVLAAEVRRLEQFNLEWARKFDGASDDALRLKELLAAADERVLALTAENKRLRTLLPQEAKMEGG